MQAELVNIIQESENVRRFFFKADATIPDFLPGQFVIMEVPGLPEFENTRSYSIASSPHPSEFELCISLNPSGKATPLIWGFELGQCIQFSEPQGTFILREPLPNTIVFICTGTGVAPFRSMLQYFKNHEFPTSEIHLIFGNRWEKDILYKEEFLSLAAAFPNFHFHPALSRESIAHTHHGYVHDLYKGKFAPQDSVHFYVCGWQGMCADAREILKEMGFNRRQYFFEQYD